MGIQLNEDRIWFVKVTFSGASVAANTTAEQTIPVTGVKSTDALVRIDKVTHQAGLGLVGARIGGDNAVVVRFSNNTGSPIVPTASDLYNLVVARPEKRYAAVPG